MSTIFAPMLALAGVTFLVLSVIPVMRFRAAFAGKVRAEDFRLGESQRVPANVSLPNRNYMNLLEIPVLFYVICFIAFLSDTVDKTLVLLAWTFVGLRVLHTVVHITYNNVFHRLTLFASGVIVLVGMWALTTARLLV